MKYNVSVVIDGRIDVEVEADNFSEARTKAIFEVGNSDWNRMELVNVSAVNAENENEEFIDY